MSIDSERKLSDLLCEHVGLVNNYLLSLPSSEVNFFEGFHLSGWYNLASLRNIVLTSLTVDFNLIPKTLKGLSENKEHGERGEGGDGGEGGGEGDWGREELLEPARLFRSGSISGFVSVYLLVLNVLTENIAIQKVIFC